jgi:hypothetical protein
MRLLTATLLFLATLALPPLGRVEAAEPAASARAAIREALIAKADLPALRPSLPSLLLDREERGTSGSSADGGAKAHDLRDEAEKAAHHEQANPHAAAARGEAASAAAEAADDEHGAADQARLRKAKKDHTKPVPPPHPVH